MSTSPPHHPDPVTADRGRRPPDWAVVALLCVGQAVVILDVSIVNVALPSIRDDLDFSDSSLSWVVNAYALTWAGFMLLGGRAADFFGRRRLFVAGLVLFTAASLVGGLAQDHTTLIVARAVQGVGGALLSPVTLTIITATFPEGPRRARALGAWTAVSGGGSAVGSALGGVITDLLSWRWVLFVNVPVGVLCVIGAWYLLRESKVERAGQRLDVFGGLLVTAGLSGVVYGTVNSTTHGWSEASTLVPLIGGLVLLAWFAVHEGRFASSPVVPLRLLLVRSIGIANLAMFWIGCAVIAHFYFLTLYLQNQLNYSPLDAGLAFLPGAVAMVAGAQFGPPVLAKIGTKPLLAGASLVSGAGLLWLAAVPNHGTYVGNLLVPMILVTFGAGLTLTPLAAAATSGIDPSQAGLASGLINTTRQVGGSIGLAVLATVAVDRTEAVADSLSPGDALVSGFRVAFLVGAGFAVAAALTALALPNLGPPAGGPAAGPDEPGAQVAPPVAVDKAASADLATNSADRAHSARQTTSDDRAAPVRRAAEPEISSS
ncbi:MFS transporter [Protofrankia symbiont of Coriaria ruscifolia]|uniref:MFS transporter n=1 Tax=Protofrankia symbiont of Coriaria ruscifolia TaxID=1306542 RepID=UPI0010412C9D|nr:MFS transporter [Protofrankia symbiont of Coriaria ruscifolia]